MPRPNRRCRDRRAERLLRVECFVLASMLTVGCGFDPRWPQSAAERRSDGEDVVVAYALDGAKQPNYFQRQRGGRVVEVSFDLDGDGKPDETVDRTQDDRSWPHCLLVLDGATFDVVQAMWNDGHFRLFPRPSRLISVFPAMTDLAMTRMFGAPICSGPEALYFDRAANRMRGGNLSYLAGDNAPWLRFVNYHAPQSIGAKAYLDPQAVFDEEMNGAMRAFRAARSGLVSAYSIGASGLGTRGGPKAMRAYMLTVERLCERLVYERRGRVRITLTSDHGHNLQHCQRVNFRRTLETAGFRQSNRLSDDRDVVCPAYGLVTFAAMFTRQPARLAEAMVNDPAVDLVAYRDGEAVVVLAPDAAARISRTNEGRFRYEPSSGDPLRLMPIIMELRRSGQVTVCNEIDDRAMFEASAEHLYPDPLHRLWECFDNLMHHPPDVALSLKDEFCHGSWLFEIGIGKVASTHGSLNLKSSSAFVLSDIEPLPNAIRMADLLATLERTRAAPARGAAARALTR